MSSTNTTSTNPLAYTGIDRFEQPRFIRGQRVPTANDRLIPGTQWYDIASGNIYLSQGNGVWKNITATTSISGLTWNDGATTTTMTTNNGYIVTAGTQAFTLPTTSSLGDELEILLNGGTSWQIAQGAGQSILVNSATTTVGAGGSITSTGAGQSIKLLCVVANTKWQTTSLIGNPTVA